MTLQSYFLFLSSFFTFYVNPALQTPLSLQFTIPFAFKRRIRGILFQLSLGIAVTPDVLNAKPWDSFTIGLYITIAKHITIELVSLKIYPEYGITFFPFSSIQFAWFLAPLNLESYAFVAITTSGFKKLLRTIAAMMNQHHSHRKLRPLKMALVRPEKDLMDVKSVEGRAKAKIRLDYALFGLDPIQQHEPGPPTIQVKY